MKSLIGSMLQNCDFNFVKYKKMFFVLSIFLMITSCCSLFINGLNLGVDFTGGILIEAHSDKEIDLEKLRSALSSFDRLEKSSVYYLENEKKIAIRSALPEWSYTMIRERDIMQEEFDSKKIEHMLTEHGITCDKIDAVGAQISHSLLMRSALAVIASIVAIFIYLFARFSARLSLSGVITILHDIILLLGIYSLFKVEFNTSSVAAVLTIIGYSINDSVVIFDKLRDNALIANIKERINTSINSTMSRTTLTSLTTALAILPVLLISTGEIKSFAGILIAGIAIGTYSSIFISATLAFVGLKEKEVE